MGKLWSTRSVVHGFFIRPRAGPPQAGSSTNPQAMPRKTAISKRWSIQQTFGYTLGTVGHIPDGKYPTSGRAFNLMAWICHL